MHNNLANDPIKSFGLAIVFLSSLAMVSFLLTPIGQGWYQEHFPQKPPAPTATLTMSEDLIIVQTVGGMEPGYSRRSAPMGNDYLGRVRVLIPSVGGAYPETQTAFEPLLLIATQWENHSLWGVDVEKRISEKTGEQNRLWWWEELKSITDKQMPIEVAITIGAERVESMLTFTHTVFKCVPNEMAGGDLRNNWGHSITIPCTPVPQTLADQ